MRSGEAISAITLRDLEVGRRRPGNGLVNRNSENVSKTSGRSNRTGVNMLALLHEQDRISDVDANALIPTEAQNAVTVELLQAQANMAYNRKLPCPPSHAHQEGDAKATGRCARFEDEAMAADNNAIMLLRSRRTANGGCFRRMRNAQRISRADSASSLTSCGASSEKEKPTLVQPAQHTADTDSLRPIVDLFSHMTLSAQLAANNLIASFTPPASPVEPAAWAPSSSTSVSASLASAASGASTPTTARDAWEWVDWASPSKHGGTLFGLSAADNKA